MNISAWSIRNPVPAILLFVMLTLVGIYGLKMIDVAEMPDVNLPIILVSATLEGAAPEQLENEVARKLEDKLATVGGIDHMSSSISDGNVSVRVSFDIEKNSEEALSEVRNAVDAARADLPSTVEPPTVSKITTTGEVLLAYTVSAPNMSEADISWLIDNDISKALLAVKGINAITRTGGVQREIQVSLDPAQLAGLGITAADVSNQIAQIQKDDSGGRGTVSGQNQSLRTLGALSMPEQLGALSIPVTVTGTANSSSNLVLSSATHLRLDQIAKVSDTQEDRFAWAALDGKPVVGFQVTALLGSSEVEVAKGVRKAVAKFNQTHPQTQIHEIWNWVQPTEDNYTGSMHLLYEGALLAVLVVWWFLRDNRATLVSAAALPLSIIPTFGVMYFAGFTLNILTLLSLSLVVGVLVDDAIVEVENIVRHLRMGKSPMQAATDAANEIGLAVVATTLTLVAVFLPTAFMSGIIGRYFIQFGLTVSVAVVASLMVARLLTPMMAAYVLKNNPKPETDSWLMQRYLKAVAACLKYRGRTAAAAGLFVIISLALVPLLPTGFISPSDDSMTTVSLKLAPGSKLEETEAAVLEATRRLQKVNHVTQVYAVVGDATSDAASSAVNEATLTVSLTPRADRSRSQSQIEGDIREALWTLPGVQVAIAAESNGQVMEVTITSDDSTALATAANNITRDLRSLKDLGNVSSSSSVVRPEIHITPDPEKMAEQGVTTEALASTIRIATYGDFSTSLAKLNLPQRQLPVRVQVDPAVRNDLEALGQLRVTGRAGGVPLSSVATLSMDSGPTEIHRRNRQRYVTLSVETNGRPIGDVAAEVKALPSIRNLPAGVTRLATGDDEQMAKLAVSFGMALLIGLMCIYAVLALLFHDFLQPFTILAALPLSIGGAMLALLITHNAIGLSSLIGILMLTGIVTKNSILLVEYAVMARKHYGLSRYDALMDACHKRARPVLMTTLAMGAGMMPVAMGIGTDPSFRAPMAIVVVGGLITSTFLSLLVIPVIYTFVDGLGVRLRKLLGRDATGPYLHDAATGHGDGLGVDPPKPVVLD
ncbi:efflux RND transporter permease subunit [Amantichitinum ursilacus]|uniref:Multidrug resistance protein MdtC n=1 Tax=Amantichitinum ursilacus TaxID=857265 RepID=A0A0N0GNB8_9NEIS|nr:efflux RND transporter permease subunit [Amantichitinum ursilacus]KPC52565.1 Multidrug resistance protein MdtC [Amantichitinum ursilacus]